MITLTEGAVGQRMEREYGLVPDPDIAYAALIYTETGRRALAEVYGQYLAIAEAHGLPIMLMTNTRRANRERVMRSRFADHAVMRDYAEFLRGVADGYGANAYIGGMMGCKGDAYSGSEGLSFEQATAFHAWQAEQFEGAPIDYLFAGIMPARDEAMAMARVMGSTGKPYIISLMMNERGTLLDGTRIHDAIAAIDGVGGARPVGYMTNCVHPDILRRALERPFNCTELVRARFLGIQANAACFSPEELDGSLELRTSGAEELAEAFARLNEVLPMRVMGGCCGTDARHIEALARRFG